MNKSAIRAERHRNICVGINIGLWLYIHIYHCICVLLWVAALEKMSHVTGRAE